VFGLHEKITKGENAFVVGIRQRPVAIAGFRPDSCGSGQILSDPGHFGRISDRIHPDQWPDPSKSGQIQLDSGHFGQIGPNFGQFQSESGPWAFGDGGRMSPDSDAGCIPMFECCRILVPLGFRRSTNVGFRESDIKHAWKKNKEFNFGIITKSFTVKQKMIFVDHYFRPYQIL
jgi:hypothetical protein